MIALKDFNVYAVASAQSLEALVDPFQTLGAVNLRLTGA
jgi:hypothetical protein